MNVASKALSFDAGRFFSSLAYLVGRTINSLSSLSSRYAVSLYCFPLAMIVSPVRNTKNLLIPTVYDCRGFRVEQESANKLRGKRADEFDGWRFHRLGLGCLRG